MNSAFFTLLIKFKGERLRAFIDKHQFNTVCHLIARIKDVQFPTPPPPPFSIYQFGKLKFTFCDHYAEGIFKYMFNQLGAGLLI
jgi:hypothetical protein